MKLIITGATGFLGSHLVKHWLQCDYEIVAIVRRSSNRQRLTACADKIQWITVDDQGHCPDINSLHGATAVVHTATCYGRDGESAGLQVETNLLWPLKLLEKASEALIPLWINVGTLLPMDVNLYTLTKHQFHQYGRFFAEEKKIRFIHIAPEQLYGPFDNPNKFTSQVIHACFNNKKKLALTPGEQCRDFIYIEDAVNAFHVILTHLTETDTAYSLFELGCGQSITIRHFVETVSVLAASKTALNFGAAVYRKHEPMNLCANIGPLKKLGWQPRVALDAGIRRILKEEFSR